MDQQPGNADKKQPKAVFFADNREAYDAAMKEGIEVDGVITACHEKPDAHDDEHCIFILEYEYEVASLRFSRKLEFSINVAHITYGYAGGLLNTPKFKYSLEDFKNAMQPGQKLKVKTLDKPPYSYLVEVNEVMAEVMRHDAVWS